MQMMQTFELSQNPHQPGERITRPDGSRALKIDIDSIPALIGAMGSCVDGSLYDLNHDPELKALVLRIDNLKQIASQKLIHIKGINGTDDPLREIKIVSEFQQNDVSLKLENIVAKSVNLPLDMELTHLEIVNCRIDEIFLRSWPELLGKKGKGIIGYNDVKIQGLTGMSTITSITNFYCHEEQNVPEKLLAHSRMLRSQPPVKIGRLKSGPTNDFHFPEDVWYNKELFARPLDMELVEKYMEEYKSFMPKPLKIS